MHQTISRKIRLQLNICLMKAIAKSLIFQGTSFVQFLNDVILISKLKLNKLTVHVKISNMDFKIDTNFATKYFGVNVRYALFMRQNEAG